MISEKPKGREDDILTGKCDRPEVGGQRSEVGSQKYEACYKKSRYDYSGFSSNSLWIIKVSNSSEGRRSEIGSRKNEACYKKSRYDYRGFSSNSLWIIKVSNSSESRSSEIGSMKRAIRKAAMITAAFLQIHYG
jgi:hypothetical protein